MRGAMGDMQHFCLRWNNYQSSITSAFENLRDDEDFVDVTLACDGKSLKAHRVVLSACSPYFRELLKSTPCKHPVIVLQDVMYEDLHALVEFIYHGEVNVRQRSLSSFLKTAEVLRVSGLTQQSEAVSMGMEKGFTDGRGSPHYHRKPQHKHRDRQNIIKDGLEQQDMNSLPLKRPKSEIPNHRIETPPQQQQSQPQSQTQQQQSTPQPPSEDVEEPPVDFSTTSNILGGGKLSSEPNHSPGPLIVLSSSEVKPEPIELTPHLPNDKEDSIDSTGGCGGVGGGLVGEMLGDGGGGGLPPPQEPDDSLQSSHGYLDSKLFSATSAQFNFSMAAALAADAMAVGLNNTPHGMSGNDGLAGPSSQGLRKVFTCVACGKVLCSKASLKRHVADKHASRHEEYRCAICERVYCSRNSLMTHIYTYHKTQRPPPPDYYHLTPPADVKF